MSAKEDRTETTHGCGQCGEKFGTYEELSDHLDGCTTRACLVCGEEFDSISEQVAHRPCPESEPVRDIEGEWRDAKRERERIERWERRRRREP